MSVPRRQNQTYRLVLVLGITGLISGGLLALAFGWLNPIIVQRQLEQEISVGLKGIFPDTARFEKVELDVPPEGIDSPVYRVFDESDNVLGVYFSGSGGEQGYGGPIRVAVGVNEKSGQIVGVKILSHTETAGIGTKVEDDSFLAQFVGRSATASAMGLDSISGATRSSNAVIKGVTNMSRQVMAALSDGEAASVPSEIYDIFPEAASANVMQIEVPAEVDGDVYEVFSDTGDLLGVWFKARTKGYSDDGIGVSVGVNPQSATLVGVSILDHNETPGIGGKVIDDASFTDQFIGKSLTDPFIAGSDVDAYTSVTKSSTGVYTGVSEISREVLSALGIEVEVIIPEATADEAKAIEPEYAQKVKGILGEDISFSPSSIWEITDENGKLYVSTVSRKEGYGGDIDVMVIIDPASKQVVGIDILKQNETPGLGSRVTEEGFLNQFVGKSVADSFVVGDDIDGVTMATNSSQAVSDAVKEAAQKVLNLY